MIDLIDMFGQDAFPQGCALIGHGEGDPQHLKPPEQQDQKPEPVNRYQQNTEDKLHRSLSKHRRMGTVKSIFCHKNESGVVLVKVTSLIISHTSASGWCVSQKSEIFFMTNEKNDLLNLMNR